MILIKLFIKISMSQDKTANRDYLGVIKRLLARIGRVCSYVRQLVGSA